MRIRTRSYLGVLAILIAGVTQAQNTESIEADYLAKEDSWRFSVSPYALGTVSQRTDRRARPQEESKLLIAPWKGHANSLEFECKKNSDHEAVIWAGRRKDGGRRHVCQELSAKSFGNLPSSEGWSHEDPAEFELGFRNEHRRISLLEDVLSIPFIGDLEGSDCHKPLSLSP